MHLSSSWSLGFDPCCGRAACFILMLSLSLLLIGDINLNFITALCSKPQFAQMLKRESMRREGQKQIKGYTILNEK